MSIMNKTGHQALDFSLPKRKRGVFLCGSRRPIRTISNLATFMVDIEVRDRRGLQVEALDDPIRGRRISYNQDLGDSVVNIPQEA
jgi:hypothetical protein